MSDDKRQQRAEEVLRELAGEFIVRNSNKTSLITVTGIDYAPDGKRVTILLSVLPAERTEAALDFANRQRDDFRDFLKKKSRLRIIPAIRFERDRGEENRQRVTELLAGEEEPSV
jgi:ribosome-binding factor A